MDKLLTLLDLQNRVQKATHLNDFSFIVTNETQKIVSYRQSVFWTHNNEKITLEGLSGNAVLDKNSPYANFVKQTITETLKNASKHAVTIIDLDKKNLPAGTEPEDENSIAPHIVLCVFTTEEEGILGGLWMERDKPLKDAEKEILNNLCESYAYTLRAIELDNRKQGNLLTYFKAKKSRAFILAALLIAFFFPTQLSITAPVEITARNPKVVSIPYDGILNDVLVKPGDTVKEGDVVATMDQTNLKAEADQAEQELQTAQISLSRAGLESLSNAEKKADLQLLRAEIAQKRIALDYAQERLSKTNISAPTDGIAIFADANAFEKKPMRTGEKLMIIAQPEETEALITIPVNAMLPISKDSPTSFYLNTQPLKTHEADILSIGYQASADPDGQLTYKIRARISDKEAMRIGHKGTAKIKSHWSILGYAVLRRPLIAMRNIMGL